MRKYNHLVLIFSMFAFFNSSAQKITPKERHDQLRKVYSSTFSPIFQGKVTYKFARISETIEIAAGFSIPAAKIFDPTLALDVNFLKNLISSKRKNLELYQENTFYISFHEFTAQAGLAFYFPSKDIRVLIAGSAVFFIHHFGFCTGGVGIYVAKEYKKFDFLAGVGVYNVIGKRKGTK